MPQLFKTLKFDESVIVEKSVKETFAFVTDSNNSGKISEHTVDVEPFIENSSREDACYKRTLIIHGQANRQVVKTKTIVKDKTHIYLTRTELNGYEVVYTYQFTPIDGNSTKISLIKEASIKGFWKILNPLIKHLLTRPEHDGRHLVTLKKAVEAS